MQDSDQPGGWRNWCHEEGVQRDHRNTPEAQRARSIIICKYQGLGLGGSQISIEGIGRSFNCLAIEVQFEIKFGFFVWLLGTSIR